MRTYENKSDDELIQLALQHENDATGELYNRYYKKVYQKCYSIVKNADDAFDLAEESMLRAFEKLDTFKREATFGTWLYIITHRHCLGFLRKKKNDQPMRHDVENPNLQDVVENPSESEAQNAIMLTLINNLPPQEKELLLMKYYEGRSIEELQHDLKLSASAVKMRLKRSKDRLNYLYSIAMVSGLAHALTMT